MKKYILIILTCCIVILSSCSKTFNPENDSNLDSGTIEFSITANAPEYDMATTKGSLGAVARVYWESGDEVAVYSIKSSTIKYLGTIKATTVSSTQATATFTGTITAPSSTSVKLAFVYPATATFLDNKIYYDFTNQTGTSDGRTKFCAYANSEYKSTDVTLNSVNFSLASSYLAINISDQTLANTNINLAYITNINTTVNFSASNSSLSPISPETSNGIITIAYDTPIQVTSTGKAMIFMAIPASTQNNDGRQININNLYTTSFSEAALAKNKFYSTIVNSFSDSPKTVSVSSNKKVLFSPGNLYWGKLDATSTTEENALHFETSQYAYPSSREATHIGHFFWSKTQSISYASSYSDDSRSSSDNLWCDENNKITVDNSSGYYALSKDEFSYLLNISNAASGARVQTNRFAKGMVNGVKGLIIFPDTYNGSLKLENITGIASINDYTCNYPTSSIDDATWSSMEAAGCVFLPGAGRYESSKIDSENATGDYSTSTPYTNNEKYSYNLIFGNGDVSASGQEYRSYGSCIRLVKDAQ